MSGKRSNGVIHHDFGSPAPTKSAQPTQRKLLYAVALVLLAVIGVSAFLIADNISLDSLTRRFTYLGIGTDESGVASEISFVNHSRNTFAQYGDGFAIAGVGGLELYSISGELLYSESLVLNQPVLRAGEKSAIVYDLGGTTLLAFNDSGKIGLLELDYPILDASVNDSGWIALTTQESGYRALVTVYDQELTERYRFHSASRYINLACVSPDCKSVTALALGQEDNRFITQLLTYHLDSEELYSSQTISDQLALSMEYISDDTICAVCDDSVYFITQSGRIDSFDYNGYHLRDFSISDQGFIALELGKYKAGNRGRVVTVSQDGSLLGSIDCNDELLSVTAAGKYVAVLASSQVNIYDSSMKPVSSSSDLTGIRDAIVRDDGSVYLIYSDHASLYIPS